MLGELLRPGALPGRGDDEGDEMPVSMASPLGKALLGGKVGDSISITLPVGKRRLKIVQVVTVHQLARGE